MQRALSEKQTRQAWEAEHNGASRTKTARLMHCAASTLEKAYKHYGLPPPHRGHYKKSRRKMH